MNDIKLKEPTLKDKENVILFLREFITATSKLNGCNNLERELTYESWLKNCQKEKTKTYLGYNSNAKVPSITFLVERISDNKLIGMVNIRQYLNKNIDVEFNGNIGYSIRPTERGKGYGYEMAKLAVNYCKNELSMPNVRLGCYYDNVASRKIIEKLGGKLIAESPDNFMAKGVYYDIIL